MEVIPQLVSVEIAGNESITQLNVGKNSWLLSPGQPSSVTSCMDMQCSTVLCHAELPLQLFCLPKMNCDKTVRMCLQVMDSGFVLNIPFLFEARIVCREADRLGDLLSGNMQQDGSYGPFGVLLALRQPCLQRVFVICHTFF